MMIPSLHTYMSAQCTHAFASSIELALEQFETLQLQGYEDAFETLMMTEDTEDRTAIQSHILEHTLDYQDQIISNMGVKVTETSTVTERTKLIQGLIVLPDYEDRHAILSTLDLPYKNPEILGELIHLVTGYPVDHFLSLLDHVSSSLFDKLRAIAIEALKNEHHDEEDHHDTEIYLPRLKAWLEALQEEETLATSFIENHVPFGLRFDLYVDLIKRDVTAFDDKTLAKGLIAFALMSRDGHLRPREVILPSLELLLGDEKRSLAITLLTTQYLMKVPHHE